MRRGIVPFDERAAKADCSQGKHLWLVTQIENTTRPTCEHVLFYVRGRCANCDVRGKSDLLTAQQLPVNEKLFEMLHPSKS